MLARGGAVGDDASSRGSLACAGSWNLDQPRVRGWGSPRGSARGLLVKAGGWNLGNHASRCCQPFARVEVNEYRRCGCPFFWLQPGHGREQTVAASHRQNRVRDSLIAVMPGGRREVWIIWVNFGERNKEGPDIDLWVLRSAVIHVNFGCPVTRGPAESVCICDIVGEAKIGELKAVLACSQGFVEDVGGFDIPVAEPSEGQVIEGGEHLFQDLVAKFEGSLVHSVCEMIPVAEKGGQSAFAQGHEDQGLVGEEVF